jgi:hypothetical protein
MCYSLRPKMIVLSPGFFLFQMIVWFIYPARNLRLKVKYIHDKLSSSRKYLTLNLKFLTGQINQTIILRQKTGKWNNHFGHRKYWFHNITLYWTCCLCGVVLIGCITSASSHYKEHVVMSLQNFWKRRGCEIPKATNTYTCTTTIWGDMSISIVTLSMNNIALQPLNNMHGNRFSFLQGGG